MARVRECLILTVCTIAGLREVCRLLYKQGAKMLIRGKNEHLLDASRRRNFHGEVASEWFGYYSLIQVDIGGHPPFPNGSKRLSSNFGNLLFLAGFNFRGHFEGPDKGFLRLRFSMIVKCIIDPPK
jgi:hypothetical protein